MTFCKDDKFAVPFKLAQFKFSCLQMLGKGDIPKKSKKSQENNRRAVNIKPSSQNSLSSLMFRKQFHWRPSPFGSGIIAD